MVWEMGEQVAGQSHVRILSGGGGDKVPLPSQHWPNSLGTELPSMHDLHDFVDRASCSDGILREQVRLPWFPETKTHLSVDTVWMELNFNSLPNGAIHVLGLRGEDGCTLKLDAVCWVDTVFSHNWLLWLFKTDVLLMLLQPRIHGMASPMYILPRSQGILYTPSVLSPLLSLTGRRKLDTFLGGRPLIWCCARTALLIRFNIVPTYEGHFINNAQVGNTVD
jgi:hypothetical protein